MLNAGAVELTQGQYESLAEHGWWRDAYPRARAGGPSTDWNTYGGVTFAFLDADQRLHRDEHDGDTPAVDRADGRREWWQHGERHRGGDRPAVEHPDGRLDWYDNGVRHRLAGPAVIYPDGGLDFWVRGRRHRTDGPAIQRPDRHEDEYYLDGVPIPAPAAG